MEKKKCILCKRDAIISEHHLIPVTRGGKANVNTQKIDTCQDCHASIHEFFSNKELERQYNTVEKLMANEKFANHVRWLSKRNPEERYFTARSNNQRRRGRNG